MDNLGVRKGAWTPEEDLQLTKCIDKYGEGKWPLVPSRAGLNRCRKSCRLRWLNYLSPNIKRGKFTADEIDLITGLHKLLGNKWSLIAGRIPGRTANDVKNYWKTHGSKKCVQIEREENESRTEVIKPQPHRLSINFGRNMDGESSGIGGIQDKSSDLQTPIAVQDDNLWLDSWLKFVEEELATEEVLVPTRTEDENIDWNDLIWDLNDVD